jgi:hypothetical protein
MKPDNGVDHAKIYMLYYRVKYLLKALLCETESYITENHEWRRYLKKSYIKMIFSTEDITPLCNTLYNRKE